MSQRNSGYKRKPNEEYFTPEWVTEALIPYIPDHIINIWEPAAGNGKIVKVLKNRPFYNVFGTDISMGSEYNFLNKNIIYTLDRYNFKTDCILTNPPFNKAQEFIEKALKYTKPNNGVVIMLLGTDFDTAKSRKYLFGECPYFSRKLILTKRIVWFPKKGAAPSSNHAWYIWDYNHKRKTPVISYWYENSITH